MPLSVNVSTGLVKGRFGSGVVAGPNGEKLLVPARGRIDFEPVAPYVPYPTGTPSAFTILRKVITGILDSEGYLCTPHPDYPDVPGVRGLELYSPDDPQAGVQGWTWRGTPRFVNADGTRLHNTMEPFTFDLPYGEEVDLVNVVDMPQSPGIGKEQAIILAASAQAAATSAAGSAEAAAADARVAREGVATAVEAASTAVSEAAVAKTTAETAAAEAGRAVADAAAAVTEASTAKSAATTAVTAAERAGSDSATARTAATQAAADAAEVKAGNAALATTISATTAQQVPPLVTQAIAADGTITTAAGVAVDAAIAGKSVVTSVPLAEADEVAFAVTDSAGGRSWLEIGNSGGPTNHSASLMLESITLGVGVLVDEKAATLPIPQTTTNEAPAKWSITDEDGRRSWIEIGDDGGPTEHSLGLLRTSLALPSGSEGEAPREPVAEVSGSTPNRKLWINGTDGARRLVSDIGDPREPEITSDGCVLYHTDGGRMFRPLDLTAPERPVLPAREIVGTGDSLTASGLYLARVKEKLGVNVVNMGKGGWASADIALRQGGLHPELTVSGNQIPASGAVAVLSMAPSDGWRTGVTGEGSVYSWNGMLAGVPGRLEHDHVAATWTFTRTAPGAATPCPAGTRFSCTDGDANRDKIHIIFSGRNNVERSQVVRDEKLMAAWPSSYVRRFLVVSVINGQNEKRGTIGYNNVLAVNEAKAQAFPNDYYDLRADFIKRGLTLAGITPTPADLAAIADDAPPPSLMADNVHPNPAGYAAIGDLLSERITLKGWLAA